MSNFFFYLQAAFLGRQVQIGAHVKCFDQNHVSVSLARTSLAAVLVQEFVDVRLGKSITDLNVANNQYLARSLELVVRIDFVHKTDLNHSQFGKYNRSTI